MKYKETLEYLFTRLPMFQRTGPAAYKNNLDNTHRLDELFGHPHRNFKTIHVAGTNGKGSVSDMLASVLQAAGYKTGLYTSPHLKDFRERIRINGKMISEQRVVDWVNNYRTNNKMWKIEPSFFELTVALAFDYFSQEKVDIAVIEVGLGGRLDSTNIIQPELSIITNIGLDHTNLLGNTLKEIAAEKAGVIKKKIPVVIGSTQRESAPVFVEIANKEQAPLYFADREFKVQYALADIDRKQVLAIEKDKKAVFPELKLDLAGEYQHRNIPAVLKSIEILDEKGFKIEEDAVYNGLTNVVESTGIKGRWQVIGNNPLVVCDTGHNIDGIQAVVEQIRNTTYKNLHFIFGTVGDKNPDAVLSILPKNAKYYFVKADIERALDAQKLAEAASAFNLFGEVYSSVAKALGKAVETADKNDMIIVGGSTFVVAEVIN